MPPKKRHSLRARAANKSSSNAPPITTTKSTLTSTSPLSHSHTKKAKRTLKHDTLLRRVRDSGIQKTATQQKRRRRPARKLEAAEDFGGFRDALPEISSLASGDEEGDEWEGIEDSGNDMFANGVEPQAFAQRRRRRRRVESEQGKMKLKSLQHRPGAMKRKRLMERREVERFGRNLAQMAQPTANEGCDGGDGDGGAQREKWAALRRFIGGTMERSEVFESGASLR